VAEALDGVGVPWCVVGGWSIDLFLGEVTRDHGDIEIEILRRDELVVRGHLALSFCAVGDGRIRALAAGELLPAELHQCWGYDADADEWRVDLMSPPGDAETWVSRRGPSAPRARMISHSPDGIPYLRPEGALLYKATPSTGEIRPKDQADFETCAPRLDADARAWLIDALTRLRPDHEWVGALREM
jgi:hypothetical protein